MILYYLFYLLGIVFFICGILALRSVRKYYKTVYKELFPKTPEKENGEITMTVKESDECIKK